MRFGQGLFSLLVVAGFSAGTVYLLAPGESARLRREKEELAREKFELQRAVERLTGEDRVAEIHVLEQIQAGEVVDGKPAARDATTLEFIEMDREQHPLAGKRFVIQDRVIHFDALVLKFEHEDVAAGEALRGKSLALFRRIYGENQNPADGFRIDPENDVPDVYRVNSQPSELELRLWGRFWDYATDPDLAARDHVRVAQGESVYVPMQKGDVWTLTLQNNGGLNIKLHRAGRTGPTRTSSKPPLQ